MIGRRVDLSLDLQVVTPVHVGTGSMAPDPDDRQNEDTEKDEVKGEIAQIHVDHRNRPYIPGSSLKGVLREMFGPGLIFGSGPDATAESPGRRGEATFWPAFAAEGGQTLVEQRTAMDEGSGVAKDSRLYKTLYVQPGTCFRLEISLRDTEPEAAADLASMLKTLQGGEHLHIGRGTRQGYGALLAKVDSLQAESICPINGTADLSSAWRDKIEAAEPVSLPRKRIRLRLKSVSPFSILDHTAQPNADDERAPQLKALGSGEDDYTSLTGSSLMGAIRASFSRHLADEGADSRDDKDKQFTDATNLSPTERLFGVSGWRGLLGLSSIETETAGELTELTSVKLDRFSGAPVDNALFTTELWTGNTYLVDLIYATRKREDDAGADLEVIEGFVRHLTDKVWGGLTLGHGGNKGFGWFEVEEVPNGQD